MALIGYCRVSTTEQTTALQEDALNAVGVERIFTDQISGSSKTRPGLDEALKFLRTGDVLVVWRLDRLSRSLSHLIETVNLLSDRGVGIRSLTENIDSTSISGRFCLHLFASLGEFEKALIRERVNAGLQAARARGRVGGRPKVVCGPKHLAITAMKEQGLSVNDICQSLGISRATYFRYQKKE